MADRTVTIKLAGDNKDLNAALQQSLRSVQDFGSTLEKVGRSQGIAFSSAIQQDVKQLEILRDHLVKIGAPAADLEKVTKRLTEAQLKFKDSLKTDAMKQQESALESLRSKYVAHEVSLSALGKTVTDNRAGFQALGGVMTAMGGAIVGSLGLSAKAAIDFESAFAGVRKTVNASGPELATMREQFLKMSTEIPVSAGELAKLGQVAGQLGVRKENVVGFARVIADLGISSNLAGEEGATMLAQFGNIVKLDQTKYSNLASALVDLGNNSATTEKDIAAMGLRLAGAGDAAGLSAPQILGLSASLASVGIEAEAGGTAFSQLLIKMLKSTKEGGDSLAQFAKVAGVTSAQFKKSFEEDAAGALVKFLKGVDGLNKSGANTFAILEGMGVEGIRMTDAIIRAANATDKFEGSIQRSSKAFNENTALAKEAGERYKTVESQLKLLANSATELAVRIGDAVLPALRSMVDFVKPIITTISQWAKENPALTTSIVAVGGAIGGFMLVVGPLLFALPSMVEGFVLAKGAVLAMGPALDGLVIAAGGAAGILATLGGAVAVTATAFAAWNIGRMIGEIDIFGTSIDKLTEKFFLLTIYAGQNAKSLDENVAAINRTASALKTPVIKQAGEDFQTFAKRVLEAAKSEAVLAVEQAKQATATKLAAAETKKGAVVTELSAEAKKKQAEAAKKAAKEIEGWGSALGVTIPKLRQTVAEGEKYVAYLKRNKASAEEVKEAERKLQDARLALMKATSPLIAETEKLLQATKDLDKAEIANTFTLAAAQRQALETAKTLRNLGLVAGTELPAEFGKPKSAILDLAASFKGLGITSTAELRQMAVEAKAQFESIRADGKSSTRDIELAWAEMTQRNIDVTRASGATIDAESQKAVDAIKSKYGDLKNDKDANLSSWRELASKQVSTLVSDVSKGFADILLSGASFGSKIISMFKNIGAGMLQGFFESGIGGLLSGKGFVGFETFAKGLFDAFKGSGTGTAKTGFNLAAFAPNAAKLFGFGTAAATTAATTGIISGAAFAPAVGGSLASIASAGTVPGFLLAGSTVPGATAGGTAAASTGGLGATGALLTNPWTIGIAAAAIGGTLLYKRLSRRGKEKEKATGVAEDLSDTVWQDIVPSVESGQISVDQGIAAVKGAWSAYEAWLRANLKDQTVITRSIESQRVTLTESLAALEKLRVSKELDSLLKKFDESGEITEELSAFVGKLNGNLSAFKNAAKIPELQQLKSGFAGLKEELLKLKPPAEDMILKFLKTGEITPQLKDKINEFGGSLAAFESFSRIRSIRDNFESLRTSFTGTKDEIDRLRPAFIEFGGDMLALDAASALPGLRSLKGAFEDLQRGIASLLPPTKSWQQLFLETGVITQEMRDAIAAAGAELKPFEDFAQAKTLQKTFEDIQKGFNPANTQPLRDFVALLTQLKIGGHDFKGSFISDINANINFADEAAVTALFGQISTALTSNQTNALISLNTAVTALQTNLDTTIGKLQTAIETALETVGTKLNTAIVDASGALITQLGILDTNLDTAIGDLQTALATEITNLTTAISNLKIPSEITLVTAPPATSQPPPEQPQSEYPYPGSGFPYGYPGGYPGYRGAEGGEGIVRKPTFFLAGEAGAEHFKFTPLQQYGKSPELQKISEMAIMPAVLERIQASVARLESGRGGSYAPSAQSSTSPATMASAPKVEQTNNFYRVSEDEYTLRQMQERANANFIDLLARGG